MPRKRRVAIERHSAELLPVEWAFLRDEPLPKDCSFDDQCAWWSMEGFAGGRDGPAEPRDYGYGVRPSVCDMWLSVGAAITEEWVKTKPGTRPSCWWMFVTEPREPGQSQLSYLLLHNDLLPGEADRLPADDFAPVRD
jgi:hypothetical protein